MTGPFSTYNVNGEGIQRKAFVCINEESILGKNL